MTLDELEQVEILAGAGIDELAKDGKPKTPLIKAVVCIVKRRTDPDFTLDQAGKLTVTQLDEVLSAGPTTAAA